MWHLQTGVEEQVQQCDDAMMKLLERFNLEKTAKKFAIYEIYTMEGMKALDRSVFERIFTNSPIVSRIIWEQLHKACVCRNRLPAM